MEKGVVFCIVICILLAWIAYLIYQYLYVSMAYRRDEKIARLSRKYQNLQDIVRDTCKSINKAIPGSTLQFIHTDEIDTVEGEVKVK